jgi:hypothetical protein
LVRASLALVQHSGAPAFCANVISGLQTKGYFDGFAERPRRKDGSLWDFEYAADLSNVEA